MTVTPTQLTSGSSNSNPGTTASISPSANTLVLAAAIVANDGSPAPGANDVALSGLGLTWTLKASQDYGGRRRIYIFRAMGTPTPGTVTITKSGAGTFDQMQWSFASWSGVDTSGTNGENAVGNAFSDDGFDDVFTITIGDTPDTDDVSYVTFGIEAGGANPTMEAGWDTLSSLDTSSLRHQTVAWDADQDLTPTISWSSSSAVGGIALLIIAGEDAGGVTVAIAHGLALGHSVQASTSVSATVAHGLALTHSVQASSTVDATVQHGLALDHALQVEAIGIVSITHGLVLDHSLTASSSVDSGLSHGLALDHAMTIVTGAVSATIQHGLVLGHQVSANAAVVTSVQHGLALEHSITAFVGDSIAVTVQHGLALTHALTAESGATLAAIQHGLQLTHAMTVDVAVVVMASIEHGLVLDHSMTVDIELDALGRPIQPLADARPIQPSAGVRSTQSSANARPIQPLFTGV